MIFKCKGNLDLSVQDRLNFVHKLRFCYNSLGRYEIASCVKLNNKCKYWILNHHSAFHRIKNPEKKLWKLKRDATNFPEFECRSNTKELKISFQHGGRK